MNGFSLFTTAYATARRSGFLDTRLGSELFLSAYFLYKRHLEDPFAHIQTFKKRFGTPFDTMDKFAELHARVNHPAFGLTMDVGHLVCNRELPVSKFLAEWKHVLWNVHTEDMRRGVHDHLMFGEGEMEFPPILQALDDKITTRESVRRNRVNQRIHNRHN
jgi:L-ribulose-5-phosphate 3-epimerase UlaE